MTRNKIIQPVMPTQTYSDKELCRLFEWIARHQHHPYWRDKCMAVRIGLGAGLRVSEVLRLHSNDISPEGIVSVWKSKTGRRRPVKASPELQPYLRQFVNEHHGELLFQGITRTRTLQRWCDEVFDAAGIPKIHKRGFHSLRHSYASYELASGRLNPVQIQNQLGHSKIEMTLGQYCHVEALSLYEENKTPKWWSYALPGMKAVEAVG